MIGFGIDGRACDVADLPAVQHQLDDIIPGTRSWPPPPTTGWATSSRAARGRSTAPGGTRPTTRRRAAPGPDRVRRLRHRQRLVGVHRRRDRVRVPRCGPGARRDDQPPEGSMTKHPTTTTLYFGPWYRRSPFFDGTQRAGCKAYDIYNKMYLPAEYDDPEVEYRALQEGVTLWDVGVERTVQVSGPDADRLVDSLTCRDLTRCAVKQCKYMLVTAPAGGIVNDPVLCIPRRTCGGCSSPTPTPASTRSASSPSSTSTPRCPTPTSIRARCRARSRGARWRSSSARTSSTCATTGATTSRSRASRSSSPVPAGRRCPGSR